MVSAAPAGCALQGDGSEEAAVRRYSPPRPGTRTQELQARRRTISSAKQAAIEANENGDELEVAEAVDEVDG
jgi:hypothetical protein